VHLSVKIKAYDKMFISTRGNAMAVCWGYQ
jgi:hypothetical protein